MYSPITQSIEGREGEIRIERSRDKLRFGVGRVLQFPSLASLFEFGTSAAFKHITKHALASDCPQMDGVPIKKLSFPGRA